MKKITLSFLKTTAVVIGMLACGLSRADELSALALAAMQAYSNASYQVDAYLDSYLQSNVASYGSAASAGSAIQNATLAGVQSILQSFPNTFLSSPTTNGSAQQNTPPSTTSLINQLTLNTPGSDTLYLNNTNVLGARFQSGMGAASSYNLSQPTTLYDNYFSIASLLEPLSYSANQQTAAQNYVTYLTQNYNLPANNIDFADLISYLSNENNSSGYAQFYKDLSNFVSSPAYENYQIAIRSAQAAASIVLDNLNFLMNERTVVSHLGSQAGLTVNGQPVDSASPLQVENYIATHRINNPNWYQFVQAASPATLQREMLIVLSEIENELYQNHMDNERILATLTVQQAMSNQSSQLFASTQAQNVNNYIKTLTGASPSSSTSGGAASALGQ